MHHVQSSLCVCEYVYYNSILFDKQLDIDILDTTKDLFILAFHNLQKSCFL